MPTPAETPRESLLRSRVIWSFWVVILFLGLPTWWQTTSIYRASLPTDSMFHPSEFPSYPVEICITNSPSSMFDTSGITQKTQQLLNGKSGPITFQIRSDGNCANKEDTGLYLELESGKAYSFAQDQDAAITKVQCPEESTEQISANLASFLDAAFADEQASVVYLLVTYGKADEKMYQYINSLPQERIGATERRSTRAFKPAPTYHLTFSMFSASAFPSSWAVMDALRGHISPLVHALSSTANFSIASQVQLYSTFSPSVQPQQSPEGWYLRKDDLTSFINAAEWPLSPSIGTGPSINFLLYVPDQKHIPLTIEGEQSNSWLISQWGGVIIHNPDLVPREESELGIKDLPQHLDAESLDPAFQTFQSQLLQLLGIPQNPHLPLAARLKAFQRLAALSLYLRASSNLGSLARLSQSLSSIPIPKHVQHYVEQALVRIQSLQKDLGGQASNQWQNAVAAARDAYTASEKAFFDKSMVGQVYFPDEHKVAVYLPLLGPIGFPLVIGLIKEVRKLLGK